MAGMDTRHAPVISVRGVEKAYGAVRAVGTLDLDIDAGGIVALLGANGAGKSTTIAMLLGLIAPDAGTVDVCGLTPASAVRAGRIAAMLQSAGMMPGVTVTELLGLGTRIYPRPLPVGDVITLAGLESIAGRRVDRLSGGQAQRVRFAMAAIGNPDVLLLDEPTAAMDIAGRQAFWAAMRNYASSGRTIVFATHYLDEVDDFADRVVVMAGGRIAADATPSALRSQSGRTVVQFTLASPDESLPTWPDLFKVEAEVEVHGDRVTVRTTDPDAAVRALAATRLAWRDLSVVPASLDDEFLRLTNLQAGATAGAR